tara:strand:+ start:584 stop:1156 length:573 start_codon:yes stop_codon:yes gene_type:complete
MAIPTSELQNLNPTAVIELFEVELNTLLHGSTEIYRFHAGTNQLNNSIMWQSNVYDKFPIQAEGFEYSGRGSLPRPTLTISNAFGFVSALIIDTNNVTPKNDLQGAKFTRRRVLASSLDNINFFPATNPFGTPNANELPKEIYFIDRKTVENRQFVQFECVSVLDLQGVRVPKRQITRKDFDGVGTFINT